VQEEETGAEEEASRARSSLRPADVDVPAGLIYHRWRTFLKLKKPMAGYAANRV
jgi:hypothetical protein